MTTVNQYYLRLIDQGYNMYDAQEKTREKFETGQLVSKVKPITVTGLQSVKKRKEYIEKRENGHKEKVLDIDNEAQYLTDQLTKAINEKNEKLQKWVEKRMEELGIKENKNIGTEKTPNGNMLDKYAGTIIGIMFLSTVFSFFRK